MDKSKLLFVDIETQPNLGYVWNKYQQDVLEFDKEWCIISFSVKWLDGKSYTYALPDFKGYKPGTDDDKELVKKLWEFLDSTPLVCAHNGRDFDFKKINSRFVFHGLPPPSPFKIIDTLIAARKYFGFTSNKLDDLGRYLKIGRKVPNGGFKLWLDCIKGDRKAWNLMKEYNEYDVILLEKLYKKLLPFMKDHPNLGMYHENIVCPKCESSRFQYRGYAVNATTKYKRAQCLDCAGWFRVGKNLKVIKPGVSA